ncbi:hypothetical protein [Fundidesulfovibrio agrisoli]|uniref:hypothetical protein n=1 Tax=Fundidesulfovibrio agrisoli TaxID=2922717 RepID=UPI001FAD4090|nr:hypothetical protein [Fundidesulfovibrio agrisoli]
MTTKSHLSAAPAMPAPWGAARLHPLDMEDVALSREALRVLGDTARKLLVRAGAEETSMARIIKAFCAKAFWNESDGALLLCGELDGRMVCLPVPAGHWEVAVSGPAH